MCNLYNVSIGPQAILEMTRAMFNRTGNLEPGNVYQAGRRPPEAILA